MILFFRRPVPGILLSILIMTLPVCIRPLSAQALEVEPGKNYQGIGLSLEYYRDKSGDRDISGVRALSRSEWKKFPSKSPGFGFQTDVFWIKLELENKGARRSAFMLEQAYPLIDNFRLYSPEPVRSDDTGVETLKYKEEILGDLMPFSKRKVKVTELVFRLELPPGAKRVYYLRQSTTSSMKFDLNLWSESNYADIRGERALPIWLYYGLMGGMLLYNFFVLLGTRSMRYVYYVLFVAFVNLLTMTISGLSFQYLWPDSPIWANLASPVFLSLMVFSALGFFRHFLEVKKNNPRYSLVVSVIQGLTLIPAVLPFLLNLGSPTVSSLYRIGMVTAIVWSIFLLFLALGTGIYYCYRRKRAAYLYLLSWMGLFLGGILYIGQTMGVLEINWITSQGLSIGIALQVVLLSFALADQITVYRGALEKLNTSLEERVSRTDGALNDMREMLGKVGVESDRANGSSTRLWEAIRKFVETSQNQAASTEQTSASVEELIASVEAVAGMIQSQNQNIQAADQNLTGLSQSLSGLNTSMKELTNIARESYNKAQGGETASRQIVESMEQIRARSSRVREIIGMINDISDRTNLLSLNASIEAARAGDAGRGFAVVADEISRLSDMTAKNTKMISDLISETHNAVEEGARHVEQASNSLAEIVQGVNKIHGSAQTVGRTLDEHAQNTISIAGQMQEVSKLSQEIEHSANEQKRTTREIGGAIESIASGTEDVIKGSTTLENTAEELFIIAENLESLAKQFQKREEERRLESSESPEPTPV